MSLGKRVRKLGTRKNLRELSGSRRIEEFFGVFHAGLA